MGVIHRSRLLSSVTINLYFLLGSPHSSKNLDEILPRTFHLYLITASPVLTNCKGRERLCPRMVY
jgi:hypothetical protein